MALESSRGAIDASEEMTVNECGDLNEGMLGSYMDTVRSVVEHCFEARGAEARLMRANRGASAPGMKRRAAACCSTA